MTGFPFILFSPIQGLIAQQISSVLGGTLSRVTDVYGKIRPLLQLRRRAQMPLLFKNDILVNGSSTTIHWMAAILKVKQKWL
jgi:hypothetical protein